MTCEYLLLLGAVALFPALLSFDRNLDLVRHRFALGAAVISVSIPFWIWDLVAIARGHWWFNPHYVIGIRLFGMPLEEWLFFPVIAFVSIFTWESVKYFHRRMR